MVGENGLGCWAVRGEWISATDLTLCLLAIVAEEGARRRLARVGHIDLMQVAPR